MYATDNTTFINDIGLSFMFAMGLLMLVLPRRHALWPVVVMICFMTMGQRLLVFGLNFTLIRVLLLFGLARVLMWGEMQLGGRHPLDRRLGWWVLSSIVTYTLLWQTSEAFVNRLGLAYDAIGLYLLFRMLVRDADDIRTVLRMFAWLAIPLAACMLVEKQTGTNPFAALGGVPPQTLVREGVLRCQGPFAHPILAGAFGSALLPLCIGLWWQERGGLLPLLGAASALTVVATAGSSGPLMAAAIGLVALGLWRLREHMRAIRWSLGLTLLALHLAMAAPVWFLLARIAVFDGSTGYHRAILIDHAIDHFGDWWLIGTKTTADWGYYMFDVTNQYVLIGVQGGLVSLLLFLAMIAAAFGAVGRAARTWALERLDDSRLAWACGASLLVHAVNYISVPYFDQNIVVWYLLLAMIATLGLRAAAPQTANALPAAVDADAATDRAPAFARARP